MDPNQAPKVLIRNEFKPGDMGTLIHLHGILYAGEHGFDHTFEAYVAVPMAEFVRSGSLRQRIWIAAVGDEVKGSLAIAEYATDVAQLRWFLLHPDLRGKGLGKQLVGQAVSFCREQKYRTIFLWTVSELHAAAAIYRAAGFHLCESRKVKQWGRDLQEDRYELMLG
jgi:GNAT superfamily N-acetyltransferase